MQFDTLRSAARHTPMKSRGRHRGRVTRVYRLETSMKHHDIKGTNRLGGLYFAYDFSY